MQDCDRAKYVGRGAAGPAAIQQLTSRDRWLKRIRSSSNHDGRGRRPGGRCSAPQPGWFSMRRLIALPERIAWRCRPWLRLRTRRFNLAGGVVNVFVELHFVDRSSSRNVALQCDKIPAKQLTIRIRVRRRGHDGMSPSSRTFPPRRPRDGLARGVMTGEDSESTHSRVCNHRPGNLSSSKEARSWPRILL